MADTSVVFNVIGRERVSSTLARTRELFRATGQEAVAATRAATVSTERLDREIKDVERSLAELNAEFARTGNKELFAKMKRDRSLLSQLQAVRREVGEANRQVDDGERSASRFGSVLSSLGGALGSAASGVGDLAGLTGMTTSNMWGLVAALGAASASLFAIGPAASLAGGALGSIPTMLTGGAAAAGTLKLGLFGLTDEYKRLTAATGGGGGGGGATKAARDFTAQNRAVEQAVKAVARAERDLRDAQRAALEAQRAINEARETAADRMRDQALDLRSARLEERDAADAVAEAQGQLNIAMANHDPIQIEKAQRAYDEAVIAAERAKIRVEDLTEANTDNAKKGVEGSNEVIAAKKREADARQRVVDAQEAEREAEQRLADSRKALANAKSAPSGGGGGGGGGGAPVTKLAPSARAFLDTIIGLRPAFEKLRLNVQEHLFAGLATRMQHLADVWKGPLTKTLTSYGDTFNGIAKTFFASASKKTFIDNMGAGAESARKALDKVGNAAAGPLVDAFGRLSRAAGPFVEKLGTLIGRVITKFSEWIRKADESGKLNQFFKDAAATLEKVWHIGEKVGTVVGKVIGIIYGKSQSAGGSALDSISSGLESVSKWLDDPKNQKAILDLVDGFMDAWKAVGKLVGIVKELSPIFGPVFTVASAAMRLANTPVRAVLAVMKLLIDVVKWLWRNAPKAWSAITSAFGSAQKWLTSRGTQVVNWVRALPGRISKAARGMFDGFRNAARSAFNAVAGFWNRTVGALRLSVPSWVPGMGGASWDVPDIQYLAKGGIVPATPGGRLAVIGEGGEDEAVIPLSKLGQMGGGPTEVVIRLDFGPSELGRAMNHALRTQPAVASEMRKHLKVTVTT